MGILQAFDHKTLIISGAAGSRTYRLKRLLSIIYKR